MLLQEALEALKNGQNVVRDVWTKEDGYLALMQGMKHVWKIVLHPNPNAGNYIFSFEDLIASDWMVYRVDGIVSPHELVEEDNGAVLDDCVQDNVNAA